MTNATNALPRDNTVPARRGLSAPCMHDVSCEVTKGFSPKDCALNAAIQIEVHSTRAAFDALEADWNDLYARAGQRSNVFQTFNWNWHWCNHYLPSHGSNSAVGPAGAAKNSNSQLAIATARVNGTLTMLWPLLLSTTMGLKQLSWMGDPVSQYGDVLCDQACDESDLLAACWEHIHQTVKADVVCLRKVRRDAVVAPLMERMNATITDRQEAVSHSLRRHINYDNYAKRFKPRALRNRRRQMRRLEELGPVSFRELKCGPDAKSITEQAIAMKRDWLQQKGLVSRAFADRRFDRFFADIALGANHPSKCVVSVLTCGNKIAAAEIGLNDDSCRYMHVIVYNSDFEKYGAGAHHMQHSIRSAFASNLETFDMLAPNTRYKTEWGDETTPVLDYAVGLNSMGRVYVWGGLNLIRKNAKLVYNRLPAKFTKFITSH